MSTDLRLDDFLRVCKDNVALPNGELVTVRVLSDLELNAKRDYALAESVRVTEQLKNPESELYKMKIGPLVDAGKDALVSILVDARRIELAREANDVYRMNFFPFPDNATEQERVDIMLKQKQHEQEVYQQRAQHIIEGEKAYREQISELPFETIVKETQARAIQVYSVSVSSDADLYYAIWCATETKDGKKRWESPEVIANLPMKVINFLRDVYREVDAIDPWALTKSESEGTTAGVGENTVAGEQPTASA